MQRKVAQPSKASYQERSMEQGRRRDTNPSS
ncbi:hypothetical protein LINPERPRIM_LOCUS8436 [Linum perenne]